jgi:hypothetical protein
MAFNFIAFRYVADYIYEHHKDDEEYLRTGIGRYYYAVYMTAANIVKNNKFYGAEKNKSHISLINELSNIEPHRAEYGYLRDKLLDLKKLRKQADYNSEKVNIKQFERARSICNAAVKILENLGELSK